MVQHAGHGGHDGGETAWTRRANRGPVRIQHVRQGGGGNRRAGPFRPHRPHRRRVVAAGGRHVHGQVRGKNPPKLQVPLGGLPVAERVRDVGQGQKAAGQAEGAGDNKRPDRRHPPPDDAGVVLEEGEGGVERADWLHFGGSAVRERRLAEVSEQAVGREHFGGDRPGHRQQAQILQLV